MLGCCSGPGLLPSPRVLSHGPDVNVELLQGPGELNRRGLEKKRESESEPFGCRPSAMNPTLHHHARSNWGGPMQRLGCDVTGFAELILRVRRPASLGFRVVWLVCCCRPRRPWSCSYGNLAAAGMDARQPVPEGIRGVDVDDMRSCLCDSLPLHVYLCAGWPSHPDCQTTTGNRVFHPAAAVVRALTRFSRTPPRFNCTVASHVGRGKGREGRLCAASCSLGNPRFALFVPNWRQAPQARNGLIRPGLRLQGSAGAPMAHRNCFFTKEGQWAGSVGPGNQSATGRGFWERKTRGSLHRETRRQEIARESEGGKRKDLPTRIPLPRAPIVTAVPEQHTPGVEGIFEGISKPS